VNLTVRTGLDIVVLEVHSPHKCDLLLGLTCLAMHCIPPDSPSSLALSGGCLEGVQKVSQGMLECTHTVLRGCRLFH
jgi:hypothetical protein